MTNLEIAAIPRVYRGVQFRSTLEASWAATLDRLAIEWVYEPRSFALPSGTTYIPDFLLPRMQTWLEVKGDHNQRIEKVREFAEVERHGYRCVHGPARWSSMRDYMIDGEPCVCDPARPHTRVVVGRAPRTRAAVGLGRDHYFAAWEAPDGSALALLQCAACGQWSFESSVGSIDGTSRLRCCQNIHSRAIRTSASGRGRPALLLPMERPDAAPRSADPEQALVDAHFTERARVHRRPRVYLAGKVSSSNWRRPLIGNRGFRDSDYDEADYGAAARGDVPATAQYPDWPQEFGAVLDGLADYVGPYFVECHADAPLPEGHGIAGCCEQERDLQNVRVFVHRQSRAAIDRADIVFAWLDDPTAHGTLWELGYAAAKGKRVVIAHPPMTAKIDQMWFALAALGPDDVVVTEDPCAALRRVLTPWQPEAVA